MKSQNVSRWRPQFILCATACLFASSLAAQSPIGSEFLVNAESLGAQNQPDLQFDNHGRLWMALVDSNGPDAEFDRVLARTVSEQGVTGPELVLADTSDSPHTPVFHPLIVPGSGGDLRLFYIRSDEDGYDLLYGQRFNSIRGPVGHRFLVTPDPPASTQRFDVAALPDDGAVVVTLGTPCAICQNGRVSLYARVLAPDDSLASPFFQVPRHASEAPDNGVRNLAVDHLGNMTVVWSTGNGDPGARDYSDIHGRRFSSAGEPIGPEFVVNTTLRGTQADPSVAVDEDGDFVVVWQTRFPGGLLRSIFGQRFSKTGKKVGPEFRVNEERVEKDFVPSVAMDREGNFVVAWQSFSHSPARAQCGQIRARLYRRDGTPAGPEFPVAPGYAACGEEPKVAFGPNGAFAFVWSIDKGYSPETGTDFDVHAARFSVSPALP
jgi:hypothetical protein